MSTLTDILRERASRRGRTARVNCGALGGVTVEALPPAECAALARQGTRALLYAACRELQESGEELRREGGLYKPDEIMQYVTEEEAAEAARTVMAMSGLAPEEREEAEEPAEIEESEVPEEPEETERSDRPDNPEEPEELEAPEEPEEPEEPETPKGFESGETGPPPEPGEAAEGAPQNPQILRGEDEQRNRADVRRIAGRSGMEFVRTRERGKNGAGAVPAARRGRNGAEFLPTTSGISSDDEGRREIVQDSGKDFPEIRLDSVRTPGKPLAERREIRPRSAPVPRKKPPKAPPAPPPSPPEPDRDGQASHEFFSLPGKSAPTQNLRGKLQKPLQDIEGRGEKLLRRDGGTEPPPETMLGFEAPAERAAHETKSEVPEAAHETKSEVVAPAERAAHETKSEIPEAAHETKSEVVAPAERAAHETKSEIPEAAHETRSEIEVAKSVETGEAPKGVSEQPDMEAIARALLEGLRLAAGAR